MSAASGSLASLSEQLADAVAHSADSVVAVHARPRLPSSGVHWRDGVVVTTEATVQRLDSLTVDAEAMVAENRAAVNEAMANVTVASRQLNHFLEEASRRPYRLLTGVTPLPRDTAADTTKPRPPSPQP